MATSTWDFKKLIVAYAGQTLSGFAGDISIDPDGGEDIATKTVGPILIRDTNGRTVLEAPAAWVARRPVVAYGSEVKEREWRIDYSDAKFVIGGLAQVS